MNDTPYYTYVLKSVEHFRFYVGMSNNVERRLAEHNRGESKSTKGYTPWLLFYKEEFKSRAEARAREVFLKSGQGKEWIKTKWHSSNNFLNS